jgi:hypothetical protein
VQLSEALQELRAKLPRVDATPEQLEAARRAAMQRNCLCSIDCPVCGGLGYARNHAGKLEPCPNVDPFAMYPLSRFGLEEDGRALTWEKIISVDEAGRAVQAVQAAIERGAGWVYLWGPPGLAKTVILKIAVVTALRDKRMAAYIRMAEILDDMRAAFDAKDPGAETVRRLDWWAGLPLLAIDEFDRVRGTEYASERRFLLMDKRYEQALRGKSITLLASNADPASLESYLYDRIQDGRFAVVHLTGDSLRPAMGWGK